MKRLRKTKDLLIGSAMLVKSTDVLAHANNPTALSGDVQGMVGIGIAGAMAGIPFRMMVKKKKHKRR